MIDWLAPVLIAPFVGSFLALLVRRLPAGRPVAWARSACEACGTTLRARHMVPLLSYAVLRGHCHACGQRIAAEHWHIEVAAMVVAAWAVAAGSPAAVWADCGFGWMLLALAWIDAQTMRLPDVLTLSLLLAGLCATAWLEPGLATDHAVAAALGYGLFRLVAAGYRYLRGRDGLGEGDAKLLAALGAWVGVERLFWVVMGGACLGLAFAVVARLLGREMRGATAIPFGPCLALAGWLVRLHTAEP